MNKNKEPGSKVLKSYIEDDSTIEMLKEKAFESFGKNNKVKKQAKASMEIRNPNSPTIEQVREAAFEVNRSKDELEKYRP